MDVCQLQPAVSDNNGHTEFIPNPIRRIASSPKTVFRLRSEPEKRNAVRLRSPGARFRAKFGMPPAPPTADRGRRDFCLFRFCVVGWFVWPWPTNKRLLCLVSLQMAYLSSLPAPHRASRAMKSSSHDLHGRRWAECNCMVGGSTACNIQRTLVSGISPRKQRGPPAHRAKESTTLRV